MTAPCWYCGERLGIVTVSAYGGIHVITYPDYRSHAATCTLANVCGAPLAEPDDFAGVLPPRLAAVCRRRPRYDDGRCRLHVGT